MIAVLFSGGLDSFIHLKWAKDKFGRQWVQPIYFDVGQSYAERELSYARPLAQYLGYQLKEIKLESLPEEKATGQIPLRNLMFILHTASNYEYTGVVFGMLKAEAPVDKNPRFVKRLQTLLDSQFAPSIYSPVRRPFTIYTPFADMTKTEMLRWYKEEGVVAPLWNTVACYTTEKLMCGECISCINRWLAFDTCGLVYPEELARYAVHPAVGMLKRISVMAHNSNAKDWRAVGLVQWWKRRQWTWEMYKALTRYCKAFDIDLFGVISGKVVIG